jgi:DNA repair exonuclease SbcCD ATPase subunit
MTIKHKVIKEFQFLSSDKKIFILKVGTILQEYVYNVKNESIPIDKEIIDNNPDFFELIDWKIELVSYLKTNKIPQPSQIGKKLIPFIEDMILTSISRSSTQTVDLHKLKEMDKREINLNRKEEELNVRENKIIEKESEFKVESKKREFEIDKKLKNIKEKEEEIEIRLNRIEKRESDYKEELIILDSREDDLRLKSHELSIKSLDLQDKLQKLNEKERNIDRMMLESSKDIDIKYLELQKKIDQDLKIVTDKEIDIDSKLRLIEEKEFSVNQKNDKLKDVIKNLEVRYEELKKYESEINKLNEEIKTWENTHWEFRKYCIPPSVLPETINEHLKKELGL